ncbi:MAG: helix-turn-helix transcriptional regulator [Pseudomonadota bacterium]
MRQFVVPLNQEVNRIEALPVPVVAYGRDLAPGDILPWHHHRRAQLVYGSNGIMAVTTPGAAYVVPPQRAVWVPGGVEHQIEARSAVTMRTLYLQPDEHRDLPTDVCVLQVTPLLRELLVEAVEAGPDYPPNSPQSRVMAVILDQICTQPVASLALPMPTEPRVLKVAQALMANPGDQRDLGEWASVVGASRRTLTRLFDRETGMSFRAWRQQLRVHRALELLAQGSGVTATAYDLGYENVSAFIAMFKRCLGATPVRYLARYGAPSPTGDRDAD